MKIYLPGDPPADRQREHSLRKLLLADAIGVGALAGMIALTAFIMGYRLSVYAFVGITFALAVIAVGMWHIDNSPYSQASNCLWAVVVSIVVGVIFFGVDAYLGHGKNPDLPLLQAAMETTGPLGFGLTLIICPVTTFIAMAGFVRTIVLRG